MDGLTAPRSAAMDTFRCVAIRIVVFRPRLTSKVMSGRSVNLTTLFLGRLVTGRFGPIPVRTPGRFCPIPFRSGRFGLGRFGLISRVGRFGPILAGRFGPLYFI